MIDQIDAVIYRISLNDAACKRDPAGNFLCMVEALRDGIRAVLLGRGTDFAPQFP